MDGAGVCASLHDSGLGSRETFEAAWSHVGCIVSREGVSAGSAGELPDAAGMGRGTASPAIFDFDKLNWLNRHYLKTCPPARLASIAWGYFGGLMPDKNDVTNEMLIWFVRV